MKQVFIYGTILTLIALVAEIAAGRHRGIYSAADWKVNLGCMVLGTGLVRPLASIVAALTCVILLPHSQNTLAGVPTWAALLIVMTSTEFVFYWVHRLSHEGAGKRPGLGWLWKLHRTHHSGKYMNVLLNYRMTFAWMLIQPQSWGYGIAIYVGMGKGAALAAGMVSFWNIVTHSHFRWDDAIRRHPRLGPLFRFAERIVVTPGQHHTHHGYGRDGASYRNYGVMISVFDTMFGTLHIPEGRPHRYGLPGPNAHWSEELFYPLVRRRGFVRRQR